ncbi:MAG: hypothetical protein WCI67_21815, partial [Chloroflexales bacterium]
VTDVLICGVDGPNATAVIRVADALLAAWPRARWDATPGFAAILAQRARGRRAKRRRPGR